jgi:hypothetical protein
MLDAFAGLASLAGPVADAFAALRTATDELASARTAWSERTARQDLAQFQFAELEKAALKPGEDDELSAAQEPAVKVGPGGFFWTFIQWTNWRVVFPVTSGQQERVARETIAELNAGRMVQLLVTNLPKVELNHTVIAYDYRIYEGRFLEFIVYDPNEPEEPGWVAFDRANRRFFASGVYDTEPGEIRAFRMYYSPFL